MENGIEKWFDEAIVLTTETNSDIVTGIIPDNMKIYKVTNSYNRIGSFTYAIAKLFSKESLLEWRHVKLLEHRPNVIKMIRKWIIYYATYFRLTDFAKNLLTDTKYQNTVYSFWLLSGAYTAAKWKKKGYNVISVARCHGGEVRDYKTYTPFRDIVDQYLDGIFFVSNNRQHEYNRILNPLRKHDAPPKNQFISRLGVKLPPISEHCQPQDQQILYIVSVSSTIPIKRIDILIDALSKVKPHIKVNWVHFGDGELLPSLKMQSKRKLSALPNIDYSFAGYVPLTELKKYYNTNQVDVIINCSDDEGVPVSIMEAFSYGIPAIARDVGGIGEIVINNTSGILLPAQLESEELARAIEKMNVFKSMPDKFLQLRGNAYELCKNTYNAEENHNKFYHCLFELGR